MAFIKKNHLRRLSIFSLVLIILGIIGFVINSIPEVTIFLKDFSISVGGGLFSTGIATLVIEHIHYKKDKDYDTLEYDSIMKEYDKYFKQLSTNAKISYEKLEESADNLNFYEAIKHIFDATSYNDENEEDREALQWDCIYDIVVSIGKIESCCADLCDRKKHYNNDYIISNSQQFKNQRMLSRRVIYLFDKGNYNALFDCIKSIVDSYCKIRKDKSWLFGDLYLGINDYL